MQTKFWFKALLMVPALCAAGLPAMAQQQSSSQQQSGDPVADAARKAREDKKNAAKPKKVFTDDDVRGAVPESPAPAAGTTTATGQKPDETGKKEDPNGEAAWRKKFKDQRDRIAKAELELDVLQRESDKAQTQYYSDPQKALEEQNNRKEINDKKAKIDAKKAELDALKQGLDDLETELRKAGGDPGWAR
jgi:chromosome segregation ATPase